MTPENEFDEPMTDARTPAVLADKLTAIHPHLVRVVLRIIPQGQKNARKINAINFDSQPPVEDPQDIADYLATMANSDLEERDPPPSYYEAYCEIQKGKKKTYKYIRFRVTPSGEPDDSASESEYETLIRASLTLVQSMQSQNTELHSTLIRNSEIMRDATVPLHEAMKQMGQIVSNAYQQTMYAMYVVMHSQREDRELELEHERWMEGAHVLKDVLPVAFRDRLERLVSKSKGEPEASSGSSDGGRGKTSKASQSESTTVSLCEACRAFGQLIEPPQWAKFRELFSEKQLLLFEKIVSMQDGNDAEAAALVLKLRDALDNEKSKSAMRKIISFDQIRDFTLIMKLATKVAGGSTGSEN